MPASSIAQILVRLFAVNWLAGGAIGVFGLFSLPAELFDSQMLIAPGTYLGCGIFAWLAAPRLSRLVAAGNDGEFNFAGLSERHLYTTAFLLLGLYFALSSFASVFSWIHFFATSKATDYGFDQKEGPSYYQLTEAFMTLGAGIVLMLTSRRWAAKLTPDAEPHQG